MVKLDAQDTTTVELVVATTVAVCVALPFRWPIPSEMLMPPTRFWATVGRSSSAGASLFTGATTAGAGPGPEPEPVLVTGAVAVAVAMALVVLLVVGTAGVEDEDDEEVAAAAAAAAAAALLPTLLVAFRMFLMAAAALTGDWRMSWR